MAEENVTSHGSLRVRGTSTELEEIHAWCKEMHLAVTIRDLYDRWSSERIWSFDFDDGKDLLMFYMKWQDKICGRSIW